MFKTFIFLTFLFLSCESYPATKEQVGVESLTGKLLHAFPKNVFKAVYDEHLSFDKNFQAAIIYFQSEEWKKIHENVRNITEWVEYKKIVKTAGLDFDYIIQHLTNCLNNIDSTNISDVSGAKPSFSNFAEDLKLKYGVQMLQALQKQYFTLKNDEQFKKFTVDIKNPESIKLLRVALEKPEFVRFNQKLEEVLGIDIEMIIKGVFGLLGMPLYN